MHNEEQALIYFLDKMQYDYQSEIDNVNLTEAQKQEILKRDSNFLIGKTTTRDWNDIKRDLRSKLAI